MTRIILLLLVSLIALFVVWTGSPVEAKKPAPLPVVVVTVIPDPVQASGRVYTIQASDLIVDAPVYIVLERPNCCAFFTVFADANGDLAVNLTTGAPGTYEVRIYHAFRKGQAVNATTPGAKLKLVGSTSFTVVP